MQSSTPLRTFWTLLLLVAVLTGGGVMLYIDATMRDYISRTIDDERTAVALQAAVLSRSLNRVAANVCALAEQNELRSYLNGGDPDALAGIAEEYLALARNAGDYGQIRFIDETGQEIVRVDSSGRSAHLIPADQLQNKGDRYYFVEMMQRALREIYISPIDLNVEHNEVEIPYQPMIRIGTPVFDGAGQRRGFVMINLPASPMLNRVVMYGALSIGQSMMLNGDGYWLIHPNQALTWGFMFPDRVDDRMPVLFSEEWGRMERRHAGTFRSASGLYTFRHIHPFSEVGHCVGFSGDDSEEEGFDDYEWILASHVPQADLSTYRRGLTFRTLAVAVPIVVLLGTIIRSLIAMMGQRQRYRAQLEALARYDGLTGLANRSTFEERLSTELDRSGRYERKFGVLYIDLDGFKGINDTLGHDAGDEVLKSVAGLLKRRLRAADTPARLGGDEFAVLLTEVPGREACHEVAADLCGQVSGLDFQGHSVGASIGVAIWPDDGETQMEVLRRADQAMYLAKKSGKNQVRAADELTA
ncbi:MAG: GGDEF domain-containing protein [Rhodospirillaceae bacterium]|nr:GGDEF domain-containing protein [Rhodospirillaceae bacterium]